MKHVGKTVVVTGGSGGIGKEICTMFCQEGAKVFFTYLRNKQGAESFAKQLTERGYGIKAIQCDVSNHLEVSRAFADILSKTDGVDILINNAGISCDSLLVNMTPEIWENVIGTNLNGAFYCIREVIPYMMENRWGAIINISSVMGSVGWPGLSHYAASKAGIDALTRGCATELGRFNITVNSIAPGLLLTDMSEDARGRVGDKVRKLTPLRRYGSPQDVAKLVNFLASEDARFITGEVYMIRGGLGSGLTIS